MAEFHMTGTTLRDNEYWDAHMVVKSILLKTISRVSVLATKIKIMDRHLV